MQAVGLVLKQSVTHLKLSHLKTPLCSRTANSKSSPTFRTVYRGLTLVSSLRSGLSGYTHEYILMFLFFCLLPFQSDIICSHGYSQPICLPFMERCPGWTLDRGVVLYLKQPPIPFQCQ